MPEGDFYKITQFKKDHQEGATVLRLLAFVLVPIALLVVIVCAAIYVAERGLPGSLSRYLPSRPKRNIGNSTNQSEKPTDSRRSLQNSAHTREVAQS